MSYVAGALIYSMAVAAPPGWYEVPTELCKQAYGADFDGQIIKKDGSRVIMRAHCYRKK